MDTLLLFLTLQNKADSFSTVTQNILYIYSYHNLYITGLPTCKTTIFPGNISIKNLLNTLDPPQHTKINIAYMISEQNKQHRSPKYSCSW